MHTTAKTFSALSIGGVAASAVTGMVAVVKSWWTAYRNRRDVATLLAFDDHMLADIGLTRGDVTCALASPCGVDPSTRLRIMAVERRAGMRAQARERMDIAKSDVELR